MIQRYLQHFWDRGLGYGLAAALVLLIFAPGDDFALKAAVFAGTTVLALLGAGFTFWRAQGRVPPRVSRGRTLERSSAVLRPAKKLKQQNVVVGILTRGHNRGRHIMVGFSPESRFWHVVAGRVHGGSEGLTYEELRMILTSEGARYLEPGEYANAVIAKHFSL
ncbi:hypothetical protein [Agromyces badenianii]|uniref:hypothetical protein n=1 Tax=Agromyces badenianii TaxID=2080742 RepID=UPI0011B20AC1|nr:hypothetical protein [Agromyces badenianii]